MSLVAGQSPPLSKLNIILIYLRQNIFRISFHHDPRSGVDQSADGLHHPVWRVGTVPTCRGAGEEDNFILAVSVGQVYDLEYLPH